VVELVPQDPKEPLPADSTTDTFRVAGATPGAWYTLSTDLGQVEPGQDQDSRYAGVQVQATAAEFSFTVRRGTNAGTASVRVEEVTGASRGATTQVYKHPAVRRFDFNGSGNVTQAGFTGVRGNHLYTTSNGYGWTQSVPEFQRGTTDYSKSSVDLYRDGHWGSAARTFQVAVVPGGSYHVRVYVGDRSFARNNIQVTVEGAEAQTVPPTTANQFQALTISGSDSNNNGILTVTIVNTGGDPYWVINGMDVWEIQTPDIDPGAANLLAATWGTEMVGAWLTDEALNAVLPAAREYWVSTGLTDWQVAELYRTPVAIGDLSYRGALGVTKPEGIWLDASGAGLGWNVGSSQWSVVSGQWFGDISHQRTTANGQLPTAAFDLLTVVTHELGHVLGYDDLDPHHHPDHIMAGVLQPGAARVELAAGRGLGWFPIEGTALLALERADGESPAAGGRGPRGEHGLLVDRVLDDMLRDDLRVSRDAGETDEDDEFEQLLTTRSSERESETDDVFARL
jgi:hypothetical protein